MTNGRRYDLDYRPLSYWVFDNLTTSILINIKGELRKRRAAELLKAGEFSELDAAILAKKELTDSERSFFTGTHPHLMGGEYLPSYGEGEIEIARVSLRSTTADVISVRARCEGRVIKYRIVDEYESEFKVAPAESLEPLTMGELIALIDRAEDSLIGGKGLTTVFRDYNLGIVGRPENYVDFVTVSSDFYPQLQAWYEDEARQWCEEAMRCLAEDDGEAADEQDM